MLDWLDGKPFSRRFGDIYFSRDSGLLEKRHVFLQGNQLAERFAALRNGEGLAVGETGFGTGLSFLCTWQLLDQIAPSSSRISLDFFSIEKYPLDECALSDALSLWPELQSYADSLITRWRRRMPGWNRWSFADGRVRLTLVLDDVARALPEIRSAIDAWFLDGFSPARNPEMWTQQVFENLARASRPGATFATYTCAGAVSRGLRQAGFGVQKSPGFGRKREMLHGCLPGSPPARSRPATVVVIGGGVAGCAAASAFAERGISVTLIEHGLTLAAGASGNPRGVLHARLSAGMNPLQRFVLASYGHVLALLDEKLPIDGTVRGECGELQLAFSQEEAQRIGKLAALGWPPHVCRQVDAAEASQLAGIQLTHGGLWFPAGGWLVPPRVCAALATSPSITRLTGYRAESLTATDTCWHVTGKDQHEQPWSFSAPVVVACTGYRVKTLAPLAHLPLTPVRGQITAFPATPYSERLRAIVCASGYLTPSAEGLHMIGATHGFNDESTCLRTSDTVENLSRLREISPALSKAADIDSVRVAGQLGGRASVRASFPGAMPLVGELLPGLYTSLGHGTRGLITAGLSGELIAAAASGQLPPLPFDVINALARAAPVASRG
ncbi:MAG: bifunctional tRNA (5-methylaminomethyl-2-thiouridine)(34)-methyltransferase MnmD/FAD-dependent 5-carboxymethylaminomethyl-2-thiouridine(34) oxidoreductase MnmC [Nitrosospira sp.]|nr:bifunctional tRNA (5-methylaminomethyl-2-thiouridine)(34)-methyltransferase MnmD/FAD-dependent 5-carboxymethylaminomethyl-2-thiouridine(34) oxidoreductase MnmC [Nitrosospira sp.]